MKHLEKAKEVFAAHSKKDTVHVTSDGQAFFEENPARNHASFLEDKQVVTVHRHQLEGDEEPEETEVDTSEAGGVTITASDAKSDLNKEKEKEDEGDTKKKLESDLSAGKDKAKA